MKPLLSALVAATLALCAIEAGAGTTPGERQVALTIESTSLGAALDKWAQQSGFQIFYDPQITKNLIAPSVNGTYTAQQALETLLAGTQLTYVWIRDKGVSIRRKPPAAPAALQRTGLDGLRSTPMPKFSGDGLGSGPLGSAGAASGVGEMSRFQGLEEVIVTGTHLQGVTNPPSPVYVYSRRQIDRSGASTVQAFSERLPQNFSSVSENTIAAVTGSAETDNGVAAAGINLRGIGHDATLVLVNGRRIAPGGSAGSIVDISLIPLSAVDRVEIVTDGASAIYGSDAVGGVANFVLRRNYEDAETRVRYGTVSQGDSNELQIGQTLGAAWNAGSAMLSYEYWDRTPLSASDRQYSREAVQPFSLLPKQQRHAAFGNVQTALSDSANFFADGSYAQRSTYYDASGLGLEQRTLADIDTYSASVGTTLTLPSAARLDIAASYANSATDEQVVASGALATTRDDNTDVFSIDAVLDGSFSFAALPDIPYAIGAQWRTESFDYSSAVVGSPEVTRYDKDRDIAAAFVELRVPLLAKADPGGSLELSLAARYEDYSDFGSSTSPQMGVRWSPLANLGLRATLGRSFKAPRLNDLNEVPAQVVLLPQPDPSGGTASCFPFDASDTCTNTLIALGGNPSLGPEKASTWTAGVDWRPFGTPSVQVSATYYSIDFKQRVAAPSSAISFIEALANESVLGPSIVQRNPSDSAVQTLAAAPTFIDPFAIGLNNVGAIIDYRVHNLSRVETDGIDLGLAYSTPAWGGELSTGVNTTYILNFDNRLSEALPAAEILNTPYNPVDLRARGYFDFDRGWLGVSLSVNHTAGYHDPRTGTSVPVASWTTADLNVRARISAGPEWMGDTTVTVGILNVADKDPPYVANLFNINFDGTNANALGRFWFVQLTKGW
jgi:iron complex outermembrane recepter protein